MALGRISQALVICSLPNYKKMSSLPYLFGNVDKKGQLEESSALDAVSLLSFLSFNLKGSQKIT